MEQLCLEEPKHGSFIVSDIQVQEHSLPSSWSICNCICHKSMTVIFSPFFLIGNLLHKNTERRVWMSADELWQPRPPPLGQGSPEWYPHRCPGTGKGVAPGDSGSTLTVRATQEGFPGPSSALSGLREVMNDQKQELGPQAGWSR